MHPYQFHTTFFTWNWTHKKPILLKVEIKNENMKNYGFQYQQNSELHMCPYSSFNNFLNLCVCV
jgi:hypothetical protein